MHYSVLFRVGEPCVFFFWLAIAFVLHGVHVLLKGGVFCVSSDVSGEYVAAGRKLFKHLVVVRLKLSGYTHLQMYYG